MFFIRILIFVSFSVNIFASVIEINTNTSNFDILQNSEIYFDKTKKLEFDDIKHKVNEFRPNFEKKLSFGYSPDFHVWIKFTLKNTSNVSINKILEYNNPLTTNIIFFENDKKHLNGLAVKKESIKSVNPYFSLSLNPYEEKTFYLEANTEITTLIINLKLWEKDDFYNKELKHEVILALFFGAMGILAIYNFFIFIFTRDKSYLFYVIYILGLIFHHFLYVGFANTYIDDKELIKFFIENAAIIVAIPIYSLGLFTKSFIKTSKYYKINLILLMFLFFIPILTIFFITNLEFNSYRNIPSILFLVYLMIITCYTSYIGNKQARFIIFGWIVFVSSGLFMFFSSLGIFNIFDYVPYFVEISFVLEALIFSIALAHRINSLQKEKNIANQRLIEQQKNETKRLSHLVEEKTKDLKETLTEKEILLKELNHRVKNNMQMIVSLIRLQSDEVSDKKLNNILLTIQNRISAMSHLHELLYKQDNFTYINTYEYFDNLIEEVKESYESDVEIHFNIKTQLKTEQAVYCGLIINELVTNSFKYAFTNNEGNITITLEKYNNKIMLKVQDDGVGYVDKSSKDSLGMVLVETLAIKQLHGTINIISDNGVKVCIEWTDE